MALLYFDGFDHIGDGVSVIATRKWEYVPATNEAYIGTRPRTGNYSLRLQGSGYGAVSKALPASGGFVIGFGLWIDNGPDGRDFCLIREEAVNHMVLGVNSSRQVVVKRGTTVLATGTTVLPPLSSGWAYIEFKGVIHDTNGSYEVRINGVPDPTLVNAGPIDTRNAGTTGQWNRVGFQGIGSTNMTSFVDDLYVCDMSGAEANDFLTPAVKVHTLMAVPGNGSNVGLTPSTGTDHGALVDESPGNTTDYNSSGTVGAKDTYRLLPLVAGGEVLGIQTNLQVYKNDAQVRRVCPVVRTGGVDYDRPNVPDTWVSTNPFYSTDLLLKNPGTGLNWTEAELNALEVGMKVTL